MQSAFWLAGSACLTKLGLLCRLTQSVSRSGLESVMHSKAALNRLILRVSKVKLVRACLTETIAEEQDSCVTVVPLAVVQPMKAQ